MLYMVTKINIQFVLYKNIPTYLSSIYLLLFETVNEKMHPCYL